MDQQTLCRKALKTERATKREMLCSSRLFMSLGDTAQAVSHVLLKFACPFRIKDPPHFKMATSDLNMAVF